MRGAFAMPNANKRKVPRALKAQAKACNSVALLLQAQARAVPHVPGD